MYSTIMVVDGDEESEKRMSAILSKKHLVFG